LIRGVLLDLSPLREVGGFRWLWVGSTGSGLGGQMARFGVLFYVWEVTKSPVMLGLTGLATGVPLVVFALLGSAVIDHLDRRTLLLLVTGAQVAASCALGAVVASGAGIWAMLLLVAALSGLIALGGPGRRAYVPLLLPAHRVSAGLALTHLSFQAALLLGPIVAGGVTAAWGVPVLFLASAATFALALVGVHRLPATRPGKVAGRRGVRAVADGIRLTRRVPVLGGALLTDLAATVLAMPVALFPMINEARFGGDPRALGLFLSSVAVGGVIASMLSGVVTRNAAVGRVLVSCAAVWGAALAGVAVSSHLSTVLTLLAVAGAADTWSVVARGTIVQSVTPELYRGRIAALEHVVGAGGPHLGDLRAGLVAGATSATTAMLVGGVSCLVVVGAVARRVPALPAFRKEDPEPPVSSERRPAFR
jgi:MFS family permease